MIIIFSTSRYLCSYSDLAGLAQLLPAWIIKTAGRWSHVGGPARVSQSYLVDLVVFTNTEEDRGTQRNTGSTLRLINIYMGQLLVMISSH